MKKLFILLALFISFQSFAQWPWEKIQGDGHLKKETREAGGYTSVASSGSWNVVVAYGESNTIQVEGDENLLSYVDTKVENGTLSIKTKKSVNLRSKNKITIYVSLIRLTGISLSGSGNIVGEGKFMNDGETVFKMSGSGNIKLAFAKLGEVKADISGSGNISLSGSANKVGAHVSGSGNVDCGDIICDDATVRINGSGDVRLNANRSIDVSIAGSGNVFYKGKAGDVKKRISGSGRLIKA